MYSINGLRRVSSVVVPQIARRVTTSVQRTDYKLRLTSSPALKQDLGRLDFDPHGYDKYEDVRGEALDILRFHLSEREMRIIQNVKHSGAGFLEIEGIPTEPYLPNTPPTSEEAKKNKRTFVTEAFALGLEGLLGDQRICNFRQEALGTGDLVFNIVPTRSKLSIKGAGGVGEGFGFHKEDAWHPQSPDFLFLIGLRQDHERKAITWCASNEQVVSELSPSDLHVLSTHEFEIFAPEIHALMEEDKGILFSFPDPHSGFVITQTEDGRYDIMLNQNGMAPKFANDTQAADALRRLDDAIQRVKVPVKLKEGTMLLVNNNRSVHTRNGYIPRFDGRDRWFQRYYLASEAKLWQEKVVCPDHFLECASLEQANRVVLALRSSGILDQENRLTQSFSPHHEGFSLKDILPEDAKAKERIILNVLLRLGPAYPYRVI